MRRNIHTLEACGVITGLLVLLLFMYPFPKLTAQPTSQSVAFFDTGHEHIPNFAQAPTITSRQDGSWTQPATWDEGRSPTAGDVVLILHQVDYDAADGAAGTIGIQAHGRLAFSQVQSARLTVTTVLVMPGGSLEIGGRDTPLPAQLLAELVFRDIVPDTVNDGMGIYDPSQFGTGLLVIDGMILLNGTPKAPTFVRLAAEPSAGDTTLSLAEAPSGWQPGDTLVLPDTRQMRAGDTYAKSRRSRISRLAPQWEELTVVTVIGSTVTLAQPLRFVHKGARDGGGTLDILPHVGNLSRNIVLRSENPVGTRGHVLITGRSTASVRHIEIRDIGRTTVDVVHSTTFNPDGTVLSLGTNQIGRYALHLHHLYGPAVSLEGAPQFLVEGNAIRDTKKWGIALHDSHYGLVRQNVVYNADGAGIVTEDGSESFNLIERNFVVRNDGSGFLIEGRRRIQAQHGHDGSGFWFRGPNNIVRDNVAANARNAGFLYNQLLAQPVMIPLRQGDDPRINGRVMDVQKTGFLEFGRNETYSANLHALEVWQNNEGVPEVGYRNIIRDFTSWHNAGAVFEAFYTDAFVVDGLLVRGDVAALAEPSMGFTVDNFSLEPNSPVGFSGHLNIAWRIQQSDIQGLRVGIQGAIKDHVLQDSFLRNKENVRVHLRAQGREPNGLLDLTPHVMILRNVEFQSLPGLPLRTIHAAQFSTFRGLGLTRAPTRILVEGYNGEAGHNFEVFFTEQRPDFIIPSAEGRTPQPRASDALQEGITNQANYDQYGLTLLSAFPACTDDRSYPEIIGYACPLVEDTSGPLLLTHPIPTVTPTTVSITWTTDEPSTGIAERYKVIRGVKSDVGTVEGGSLALSHTLTLSGLQPGQTYRYRLSGEDAAGNTYLSLEMTFTTPG